MRRARWQPEAEVTPAPGIVRAHADPPHMPACRLCLRPSSSLHLQDMINIGGRAAGWTARSVRRWATDYRSGKAVGALGRPEACSIDHLIHVIVTCQDRAKENRAVATEELARAGEACLRRDASRSGPSPSAGIQLRHLPDVHQDRASLLPQADMSRGHGRTQTQTHARATSLAAPTDTHTHTHTHTHIHTHPHTHTHTHTHARTRHHSLTQSPVHSPG